MDEEQLEAQKRMEEEARRRAEEEARAHEEEKRRAEEEERQRKLNEEHSCAYCLHLKAEQKKEGQYYCEVLGKYILANKSNKDYGCGSYEDSPRNTNESIVIYEDSETLEKHQEGIISGRYCSDCIFFNDEDKKGEGCYMCTKRNEPMYANTPECYMFEPGTRGQVESEKLYDEAKEAKKKSENSKTGEVGGLLVLAIILLIGAVIVNVFLK